MVVQDPRRLAMGIAAERRVEETTSCATWPFRISSRRSYPGLRNEEHSSALDPTGDGHARRRAVVIECASRRRDRGGRVRRRSVHLDELTLGYLTGYIHGVRARFTQFRSERMVTHGPAAGSDRRQPVRRQVVGNVDRHGMLRVGRPGSAGGCVRGPVSQQEPPRHPGDHQHRHRGDNDRNPP